MRSEGGAAARRNGSTAARRRAAAAAALLALVSSLWACRQGGAPGGRGAARVRAADPAAPATRFLGGGGGDAQGFARALAPRPFEFPADHGSHPAFRTEWWYFTGNVFGGGGRHYGFELTFFRYALAPQAPERPSAWATNQVWMAHFVVTDTASRRLLAAEHLSRGALGLAGARADPPRVWVENWSAAGDGQAFRLAARDEHAALDVVLDPVTAPVANGDRGLDRKGPEPGNASYYYSIPKLAVRGTLSVDGRQDSVRGFAWMDREWSTSALGRDEVGWDWFALQLGDGRELMFYRLRRRDGTASPFSGGSLIEADGTRTALGAGDVSLEPLDYWASAASGARYPVAWRLAVRGGALDLTVRPWLRDQEIDLSVRYWEGAVKVEGSDGGRQVGGNGYLELVGY